MTGLIADGFLALIAERLGAGPDDRTVQAARPLATVEGAASLAAVDRGQVARAALSASLDPHTDA